MSARWRRYKRPRNERVGNFFFTLSIIAFIIGMLPILSKVAAIAYYIAIGVIVIGTIGLIMLVDGFRESLTSSEERFEKFAELIKYTPYILGVAAFFALIATIIYAKSTTLRRKGGNVVAGIIFTALPIVVIIFVLVKP